MTFSPPLLNMLSNKLLQDRYIRHIEQLIELSEKEIMRTSRDETFNKLAIMYNNRFKEAYKVFVDKYDKNIIKGFKQLQDAGVMEIIPVVGTHPYLPLMKLYPRSVRAQVRIAISEYERFFAKKPLGIWLPECGYYDGISDILSEEGIKYFFLETHGILFGKPRPRYGVYAPIRSSSSVYAFARDPESSKQVWSSKEGYPGDYDYREYYRDIGFDLDFDYIKEKTSLIIDLQNAYKNRTDSIYKL
jgi:1,4-alpha-glucan branching enzyme